MLQQKGKLSEKEGIYLGMTDAVFRNRHWIWSATGKTAEYTNWMTGEPNNLRGKEFCVEMDLSSKGQWNDIKCDGMKWVKNTLCEKIMPGIFSIYFFQFFSK